MKWLKIISLSIFIWIATLLWVEVNTALASPLVLGLVIGLVAIMSAYYLGRYVEHSRTRLKLRYSPYVNTTRLMLGSAAQRYRRRHSNPTLPMSTFRAKTLHSQRTRPMSMS